MGLSEKFFPALQAHPLGTVQTKILVRNSLQGCRFQNTFEGQLRAYEVSSDSLVGLRSRRPPTLHSRTAPLNISRSTGLRGGWPDRVRHSDIEPLFVCKACGKRGADVRGLFAPARMGTG
jgi:hypothetical protein